LKGIKRSTAAERPLTASRNSGEVLEGSGFVPEPPHSPGFRVYMLALDMIFIPLARLKAACRNQPSKWFLMIVVNLARLPRPWRWLMPKYCSTIYRILDENEYKLCKGLIRLPRPVRACRIISHFTASGGHI
jgi:hypothetical protein